MPKVIENKLSPDHREFIRTDGTLGANTSAVLTSLLRGTPSIIAGANTSVVVKNLDTGTTEVFGREWDPVLEKETDKPRAERKEHESKLPAIGEVQALTSKRFISIFWVVVGITILCLITTIAMAILLPATPTEAQKTVLQLAI